MAQHRLNVIPSRPDPKDFVAEAVARRKRPSLARNAALTAIVNQGPEGDCTGESLATVLNQFAPWPVSGQFIYWNERVIEGTTGQDAGAMPRDGLKALRHVGYCAEASFPTIPGDFNHQPPMAAYEEAKRNTIASYARLHVLNGIKDTILANQEGRKVGVILGIAVWDSLEATGRDGVVAMPGTISGDTLAGYHCVKVDGYEDSRDFPGGGRIFVPNTWGTGFADRGYMYLPYAFVTSVQYTFEMWKVTVA
jgi:hypothetical protein